MGAPTTTPTAPNLQVRLLAGGLSDPALRAAHDITLSLPATVGRKALQSLLVHLLPATAGSLPEFHFLAYEEPLRTTLDKFLARRSLSTEKTVPLTYYLPLPPPAPSPPTCVSPAWLSSLSVVRYDDDVYLLTGSYSGAPSILCEDRIVLSEEAVRPFAHKAPVKSVSWLPDRKGFLTASTDQIACLWRCNLSPDAVSATPEATFRSDETGVPSCFESIAVSPSATSPVAALSGADGSIYLLPDLNGSPSDKTALPNRKRKEPDSRVLSATRLSAATGLCVSEVAWRDTKTMISAGWDGMARVWDAETGQMGVTVPCGGKAVTGLAVGEGACVVGAADGAVRVVDGREGRGVVGACGRRGAHRGVVADVDWVEDGAIVSGGLDGSVRIWDLRAIVQPVHVVADVHGKGGKCLAVCGEGRRMFSAGSDGNVVLHRMER